MENLDNKNIGELEQLRADYNLLKSRLEKQAIINDRLMKATFKSKVRDIHSVRLFELLCGLFVIIIAPFSFHYGPLNLSWEFVVATDIIIVVCMWFTWYYHRDVKVPEAGDKSLREFAESVKLLKKRYQEWLKYGIAMITVWIGWMLAEMFAKSEDMRLTAFLAACMVAGGAAGSILGYRMRRKVIRGCDEIISQIDE